MQGNEFVIDEKELVNETAELQIKAIGRHYKEHKLDIKVDIENGKVEIGNICNEGVFEKIVPKKLSIYEKHKYSRPEEVAIRTGPVLRDAMRGGWLQYYCTDEDFYQFYDFENGCPECADEVFESDFCRDFGITIEYNPTDIAETITALSAKLDKIKKIIDTLFGFAIDNPVFPSSNSPIPGSFCIVCRHDGKELSSMKIDTDGTLRYCAINDAEVVFFTSVANYIAESYELGVKLELIGDRYFTNTFRQRIAGYENTRGSRIDYLDYNLMKRIKSLFITAGYLDEAFVDAMQYAAQMPNLDTFVATDSNLQVIKKIKSGDIAGALEAMHDYGMSYVSIENLKTNPTLNALGTEDDFNCKEIDGKEFSLLLALCDALFTDKWSETVLKHSDGSEETLYGLKNILGNFPKLFGEKRNVVPTKSFTKIVSYNSTMTKKYVDSLELASFSSVEIEYTIDKYGKGCANPSVDTQAPKTYDIKKDESEEEAITDFYEALEEETGKKTINIDIVPPCGLIVDAIKNGFDLKIEDNTTLFLEYKEKNYATFHKPLPNEIMDALDVVTINVGDEIGLGDIVGSIGDTIKHIVSSDTNVENFFGRSKISGGIGNVMGYPSGLYNVETINGDTSILDDIKKKGLLKSCIENNVHDLFENKDGLMEYYKEMFDFRCADDSDEPLRYMPKVKENPSELPDYLEEIDKSFLNAVKDFVSFYNEQENGDRAVAHLENVFYHVVEKGEKVYFCLSDEENASGERIVSYFIALEENENAIGSVEIKQQDDGYTFVGDGNVFPPKEYSGYDIATQIQACEKENEENAYIDYTITQNEDGSIEVAYVNNSSIEPNFFSIGKYITEIPEEE